MTRSGPADTGPAIRTGQVPPLAAGFTARPETAPGLAGALVPGAVVVLAPAGPPGLAGPCGKTQLAVHAAGLLRASGRVWLLAWVDASSRASVLSGYAEAAAAGVEAGGPAEQTAARFHAWLASTDTSWLVVLDDLRDAASLNGLWPAGPAGTTLITTPDARIVTGRPGARILPVGGFSTREATSYLTSRLEADRDQRQGAIDLALALGGDPCALAHAAAVIAASTWTCLDYHRCYTSEQEHLAARRPGGKPASGVAVTWRLSAERAARFPASPAARLQLALAALLDGQPVPAPVFTAAAARQYLADTGAPAADPGRAWQAVRTLEHAGLVTIDPAVTPPLVRMPAHVAALARAEMPGRLLARAAGAVADALLETWPEPETQPWLAACHRACAAALLVTAGDRLWTAGACHPLLAAAGHSLDAAGLTGPAVSYWDQLAATTDRILGPHSPAALIMAGHLARALLTAGQAPQAAARWQHVTAALASALGPDHPDTLIARISLGHALAAAGQPADAVTILEQAAASTERTLGPGHPATISARAELAAACQAAGQADRAISHYQAILTSQQRLHGSRHPATVNARGELAAAYLAAGQHGKAISCYQNILTDRQRTLGDHHLDTIATRRELASAYRAAGQIAAALRLHEQACDGFEHTLGEDHPATLASRVDLASTYLTAGRLTDATTLLRETLTRCQQALPAGHPLTQTVRQTLASVTAGHPALCPRH